MNNIKQALESAIEFIEGTASFIPVDYDNIGIDAVKQCKAALAEVEASSTNKNSNVLLDKCEPVVLERDYNFMRDLAVGCEDAWNKLQEQKPIATIQAPDPYDERDGVWFDLSGLQRLKKLATGTKLYTSPPQKQWVGLSEQQIREIKDTNPNNLVKATEAKLKQLNTKG